jgi:hypothetical protein
MSKTKSGKDFKWPFLLLLFLYDCRTTDFDNKKKRKKKKEGKKEGK